MGVRFAVTIGFVVVLLTCAAIGQGGTSERAAVIIADLQCTGDVLVTRAGGEQVAAYVGLQLFPKDAISATAPAVVTLFDDGSGTITQDVNPGTPFVLGAAKAENRTLVAGLTSSISDLFGSAEQARKRDQEVGAVQAGAVIARLPVAADAIAKDLVKTRAIAKGLKEPGPSMNSVAPRPSGPGGSAPQDAEQDAPAANEVKSEAQAAPSPPAPVVSTQGQPAAPTAPAASRAPAAPAASPVAPATTSSEGSASEPAVGGTLEDSGSGERARQPVSVASDDAELEDEPHKEIELKNVAPQTATKEDRSVVSSEPPIARLEHLRLTHALARAKAVAMPEGVPLLAGRAVRGITRMTSGGAAVTSLDQSLVPGAKLELRAEQTGTAWTTELVIATDAEWNDVKARAAELMRTQLPNKRLLVANLLEARGYVLFAYAIRIKAARRMEREGRHDSLARSLWTVLGQQALQLGDWSTASQMAVRARKK